MPNRDALGRILPGNTLNPGGRPHSQVSIVKTFQKRLEANPKLADELIDAAIKLAKKPDANTINMLKEWVDGKTPSEVVLTGIITHIGDSYAQKGIEAVKTELEERNKRYLDSVDGEVISESNLLTGGTDG